VKLLVASPYYPPSIGGAQGYARSIACGLARSFGWEVVVVTTNHAEPSRWAEEERDGLRILRLPRWLRLSNTPMSLRWPATLRGILQRERPDLVNGHAPVPVFADVAARIARAQGVPFVLTYHSGSMVRPGFALNGAVRLYERLVLPRTCDLAARIVCSSESVRAHLGRPAAVTITPGTALPVRAPAASTGSRRILFVGSLDGSSAWKGIDVLVRAMQRVQRAWPDALLTFVGDGDGLPGHRRRCERAGVRTEFRGARFGEELSAEYARCAMLVLPSISEAESFGMVLVEAMAHGRPVIGSRIGGIPLVVRDGRDGLLVPPGDPAALASAIESLLADPARADALGAHGRAAAARYDWAPRVEQTHRIFAEVVSS
jgi:glycosyltransferase involved in cell wall biosynthesis